MHIQITITIIDDQTQIDSCLNYLQSGIGDPRESYRLGWKSNDWRPCQCCHTTVVWIHVNKRLGPVRIAAFERINQILIMIVSNCSTRVSIIIIVIIIYFENVTFFHAKLGSYVYPRIDNQTLAKYALKIFPFTRYDAPRAIRLGDSFLNLAQSHYRLQFSCINIEHYYHYRNVNNLF